MTVWQHDRFPIILICKASIRHAKRLIIIKKLREEDKKDENIHEGALRGKSHVGFGNA